MTVLTHSTEFQHLAVRYDQLIAENLPHNPLNIETSSYLLHTFYALAGKYASFALLLIFDAPLHSLCLFICKLKAKFLWPYFVN